MKKYLWLILIACVLMTCTLAVTVVADGGTTAVVYLDGVDGNDNNQGATPGAAVLTLARAYELLAGGDGTIVIMNDLDVYTSADGKSSSFSVASGNVVYTSKDPESGELYPATIFVRDAVAGDEAKDYLPVFTPTTFEYITFDAVTGNSTQFVTGKSLTFGEGMIFLRKGKAITNTETDEIVVRCGSASGTILASYTQKSGTISSIYGGNEWQKVGNTDNNKGTTINISGDSQILVRLECGGNKKYVSQTDMTISGNVYINTLNLTGYSNGNVKNSYITITGGTIDRIWGQRSSNNSKTNTLANLSMTISGDTTFGDIDLSKITISGTATLSISNLADDLTFTEFDSYWDSIVIGDNVKLHLDGAYPANVPLSIGSNSILYLDTQTNVAPPANYTKTGDGSGLVVLDKHEGHDLTHVEAFCGENGVIEHYRCDADGCPSKGNCYADAAGLTPISKESTKTDGNHSLVKAPVVCSGNDDFYCCSVCGEYFADKNAETELTEGEYLAAAGHKAEKVAVKAPTCVVDGILEEHWHCEYCNWNFRDEACTDLIKYSIIDPKTGHHELKPVAAKEPSCTEDGYDAHYTCEDCGGIYTAVLYRNSRLPLSAEQVTVKARHTLTYVDPVPATDDAHGTAGYWTCKVDTCANYGKRFADEEGAQAVTDADLLTHKLTKVDAKEATATEPGNKAYWVCASCDKIYADAEGKTEITLASTVIPATGEEQKPPVESEPEETQKPTTPADPDGPDTGDHGAVLLAAVMLILSAVGVLAATELKRRWR